MVMPQSPPLPQLSPSSFVSRSERIGQTHQQMMGGRGMMMKK
jgi:hypothetical protein